MLCIETLRAGLRNFSSDSLLGLYNTSASISALIIKEVSSTASSVLCHTLELLPAFVEIFAFLHMFPKYLDFRSIGRLSIYSSDVITLRFVFAENC